jgi:hypothetical protein
MWNLDSSQKRVKKQYDDLRRAEINVQRLSRETDLENGGILLAHRNMTLNCLSSDL